MAAIRFPEFINQIVGTENAPHTGDLYYKEAILHFANGLLDDDGAIPAVQCEDGHFERYRDGKLHCEDGPAISSIRRGDEYAEYYVQGLKMMPQIKNSKRTRS